MSGFLGFTDLIAAVKDVSRQLSQIYQILGKSYISLAGTNVFTGSNTFNLPVIFAAETAPATPAAGTFVIYMDSADNKLKAKGPSGTITILASP